MADLILAVNAGSSSLKVSVFKASSTNKNVDPQQLADIEVSGLSSPPATLKYERGDKKVKGKELQDVEDQESAFRYVLEYLLKDDGLHELSQKDHIKTVCHRIVHGGDYPKIQVIDKDTYHHLEQLSDLAPLHNAVGLTIVRAVSKELPNAKNFACFDSAYHSTMPKYIKTYAIDQEIAEKKKLRKYGFHGISYSYIARTVADFLGKDVKETNLIALHLGSGASACAIKNGESLDTSMGLTPVAGLPGGSRSGDIDASLVFHYTSKASKLSVSSTKDMHITEAEEILNKKSGFKGLTGKADFGEIAASDDPVCKLAVELFADRVLGYIGSYYVKLGGKVDALVFAGGIGEKAVGFRQQIVEQCDCLGFEIDAEKNATQSGSKVADISSKTAKRRVLICQTDEQLEMARASLVESDSDK